MNSANAGYTRPTHDVETQNDERLDGLLGKVKILKDVSGSPGLGTLHRELRARIWAKSV